MGEVGKLREQSANYSRSASERAKAYTPSQADRETIAQWASDAVGAYIGANDDEVNIGKRRNGDGYYVDIFATRKAYGRQYRLFYDSENPNSRDIDEEPFRGGDDLSKKIMKRFPQVTRVIVTVETD